MRIGLTGGVATGKSVVTAELKKLGAFVVDADMVAREVVEPGRPAYHEIVSEFGPGIVTADGTLDRRAIAEMVFSDPALLKRLNGITHPAIRKKINSEVARLERDHPGALIVVDAALLIENGLYREMSRVVVVTASDALQVERLKERDGLSATQARQNRR
jgi:dephospho-CoA kinase